jgi:hypothetical protein
MKITVDIEDQSGASVSAEVQRFDPPGGDVLGMGIERTIAVTIRHIGQQNFLNALDTIERILRVIPNTKE